MLLSELTSEIQKLNTIHALEGKRQALKAAIATDPSVEIYFANGTRQSYQHNLSTSECEEMFNRVLNQLEDAMKALGVEIDTE